MNRPAVRRRPNIGSVILAAVAISLALITLFSLEPLAFLPDPVKSAATAVGQILIQLVTVVGALAVIIGVLNLFRVHLGKASRSSSRIYSVIMLITFIAVIAIHVVERLGILKVVNAATDTPLITLTLMDAVQVTIESALAGILFFFLVFSAYRLLRRRITVWSVLFIATLTVILAGYIAQPGSFLYSLQDWVLHVPVTAGTRGLLIGIAIGTVAVGARLLLGQHRIFRG
jgi:hypothetical protein